jgi:DMSO/TMAO reductase YedYZ molybdopterin-dependent catalytic subunit
MEGRVRRSWAIRALVGLGAGALASAGLLGLLAIGARLGFAMVAFSVFEWLIRVLPGRLVIFGLETTLRVLEALGLNIKDTAKATEQALALTSLFAAGALSGLAFFVLVRTPDEIRVRRYAQALGAALGLFSLVLTFVETRPTTQLGTLFTVLWVLGVFQLWAWALARMYLLAYPPVRAVSPAESLEVAGAAAVEQAPPAAAMPPPGAGPPAAAGPPPAEVIRLSRRRFVIGMGGAVATFVVLGAELAEVLSVAGGPAPAPLAKAPIPFPNAGSAVKPVPGTRPEYTPVPDFYRVDIDLTPPAVDAATWRLRISGMVAKPLALTLDQLRSGYRARQEFITLECISNPVGGPLIGTTLWTGPSFRDVIADAAPRPGARWAHLLAADGYDEAVDLATVHNDPRLLLVYDWNGHPLPQEHGFPLRVYVPDVYGMKQPKWITDIVLVSQWIPGYWVKRGWDANAIRKTTSVIDTVATDSLTMRAGHTYVPVGGIADAGHRGISKVEVQVDEGPWEAAELRPPLSGLTWVLWRYEWPFQSGEHVFKVRAYDGTGALQTPVSAQPFPAGATGIDTMQASVLPKAP